jgi:cardiolipin synthase
VVVEDAAFARIVGEAFDQAVAASREVTAAPVPAGWWALLRRGFVAWCAHWYLRMAGITGRY